MKWHGQGLFQKCIIFHFFLTNLFLQTFLLHNWILRWKNSIFANLLIFFADSKSRAQELSNDVFKYPSRDRINKQFTKPVYNDWKIIYKCFESSISKSDERRNWNVFLLIFVFRHITYRFKSIFLVLYFSFSFFLTLGQVTIKNWSDFWIW